LPSRLRTHRHVFAAGNAGMALNLDGSRHTILVDARSPDTLRANIGVPSLFHLNDIGFKLLRYQIIRVLAPLFAASLAESSGSTPPSSRHDRLATKNKSAKVGRLKAVALGHTRVRKRKAALSPWRSKAANGVEQPNSVQMLDLPEEVSATFALSTPPK